MIVRLDKEQVKIERRKLLSDDVFVVFHDVLKEWQQGGITELTPAELFLSAKSFSEAVVTLPDAMEGLEDEIDDLVEEASGEDDAMIITMMASGILYALGTHRLGFDAPSVIKAIYVRWNDHHLFFPFLEEGVKKEQARWLEGKKTHLLMYELEEINKEKPKLEETRGFVKSFVDNCMSLTGDAIEKILVPLMSTNENYNNAFDDDVNRLKKKLGIKTEPKIQSTNIFEKDSSQYVVNPQSGSITNVGCDQKDSEFKTSFPLQESAPTLIGKETK